MTAQRVLVTGGAGYIGTPLTEGLLADGHEVRVLDVLLHGQEHIASRIASAGAEVIRGDLRDEDVRRRALDGVDAVVHLAAIVGDPACAKDPVRSDEVNVQGTASLVADAGAAGIERFVFASTCSNYGRMADPTVPIAEDGVLAPVSLYAEQKVKMERSLLAADGSFAVTCLRFATVYGVAPRMRFDLTVNEFVRDLWAEATLEVFGQQFWRPYVHVTDAGRAVRTVLGKPAAELDGEVFNVGRSHENYRKLDLVDLIGQRIDTGTVEYVQRDEDPRDYKVASTRFGPGSASRPR